MCAPTVCGSGLVAVPAPAALATVAAACAAGAAAAVGLAAAVSVVTRVSAGTLVMMAAVGCAEGGGGGGGGGEEMGCLWRKQTRAQNSAGVRLSLVPLPHLARSSTDRLTSHRPKNTSGSVFCMGGSMMKVRKGCKAHTSLLS